MKKNERLNILIVDDLGPILESFEMILKIRDYECVCLETMKEALDVIEKRRFDMAIVNLGLSKDRFPGIDWRMNGMELLKAIKKNNPDTEVVICTAWNSEEMKKMALDLGALAYLLKPFLMEDIYYLIERVEEKLGKR